jgi:hypothetical protein
MFSFVEETSNQLKCKKRIIAQTHTKMNFTSNLAPEEKFARISGDNIIHA